MNHRQLFDEIEACKGYNNCWGIANQSTKPVVVPCVNRPKIMLLTEQRPCNTEKKLIEELIEQKRTNKRIGIIPSLETFFEKIGGFLNNLVEEERAFKNIYWTHYIKCPGNIRTKKTTVNLKSCAERWLIKEIKEIKPKVVISMGASVSKWLLKRVGYKNDWREKIWEEFAAIIQEKPLQETQLDDISFLLIVTPHPSTVSPLRWFNEKLAILLTQNV